MNILQGDCIDILKTLPDESVQTCVTSPPYYGLRDYGVEDQIGLEETPELYVEKMVAVFREVRRVLRDDGVVFLNLGDSYFSGDRRVISYDIYDKALEDYPDRDCLCGNLCDGCLSVYHRISHIYDLLVPMLVASLSETSPLNKEFLNVHLPTSDLSHLVIRIFSATLGILHYQDLSGEQILSFQESMPDEFSRQLLDVCLQRAIRGECLLCARSLTDYVPVFSRKLSHDSLMLSQHSQDNASHDVQLVRRNLYKGKACEYCNNVLAYQDYTTTYLKPKDLIGIPWRVAFALQADGWWLRSDIIWHKPNPMPESVTDRPTKAHEYIFLLSKSARYYYDHEAIKEPRTSETNICGPNSRANVDRVPRNILKQDLIGKNTYTGFNERWSENETDTRNKRTVWTVSTKPYSGAHFATFPEDLIEPCILAGAAADGVVLDPFCGSGTTGAVCKRLGRDFVGIELNPEYIELAWERINAVQPPLFLVD